jgi:hypothetical protein
MKLLALLLLAATGSAFRCGDHLLKKIARGPAKGGGDNSPSITFDSARVLNADSGAETVAIGFGNAEYVSCINLPAPVRGNSRAPAPAVCSR